MRAILSRLKSNKVDQLRDGLDNAIYRCCIEPVLSFLSTIDQMEEEVEAVVTERLNCLKEVD